MLINTENKIHAKLVLNAFDNATLHQLKLKTKQKSDDNEINNHNNENQNDDNDNKVEMKDASTIGNHASKVRLVARSMAHVILNRASRQRQCRVIVRNLSFLATETNVASKLSKFGPIVEVSIPRVSMISKKLKSKKFLSKSIVENHQPMESEDISDPSNSEEKTTLKSRGFAFVTFLCYADACAAAANSSGLRVCNREVAIDMCERKDIYREKDQNENEDGDGLKQEVDDAKKEIKTHDDDDDDEEEEEEREKEDSEGEMDEESASDDSGDDKDEEDSHDDSINEEEDEEDDEKNRKMKLKTESIDSNGGDKEIYHDANEGRTVFVR